MSAAPAMMKLFKFGLDSFTTLYTTILKYSLVGPCPINYYSDARELKYQ